MNTYAYRLTRGLLVGAVLSLVASIAPAQIAGTPHNLGSQGTGPNTFSGTADLCVFCHTPHGADITNPAENPPLWNRLLPAPGDFQTYATLGSSTLSGEVLPVGSTSIACLSCHDGTQAMNVMINAPGSGGYDPNGFTLAGTWTGPVTGGTPVGSLNYPNSAANIGTDLRNDHPIGVEYAGGGCEGVAVDCNPLGGDTADPDFQIAQRIPNGGPWFIDTAGGTADVREKTDMILFTRAFAAGSGPSVECGSCHDPHTNNDLFLRISNDNSAVCLSCHIK